VSVRERFSSPASLLWAIGSFVGLAPGLGAQPLADTGVANQGVVSEIDSLVRAQFYRKDDLVRLGWPAAVEGARTHYARARDEQERADDLNDLLSRLGASHTGYFSRSDPAYWQLASIFEPVIAHDCAASSLPPLPVTVEDIEVFWKHLDARWFVGGVYSHGPAEAGGLRVGDEILQSDDEAFSPVKSFLGKAGEEVTLSVRRLRDQAPIAIKVVPQALKPHDALLQATSGSWRIVDHENQHYAYLRIWSWTSTAIQPAVLQAITKSNQAGVDGFILDLRDGWGGASPSYLSIFDQAIPVLEAVEASGKSQTYDAQIRKPTVMLINGGTRSGKEIVAYGAKTHHRALLVGERTAGAVAFGEPFCLTDGALLYLAVTDALVDGKHLEGVGVAPDQEVRFDPRYANGADPQLDEAIRALAKHRKRR